jgi:hypothetical protein
MAIDDSRVVQDYVLTLRHCSLRLPQQADTLLTSRENAPRRLDHETQKSVKATVE